MKIRTLIVDDEPLARERLRSLLAAENGFEVVGEAANGREAIGAVFQLNPELMFLDIQMPEMDGFAVIRALETKVPPAVVFATAYDQFAVKAFEVHAVDYLLKPFDADRLQETLRRVTQRLRGSNPAGSPAAGAGAGSVGAGVPAPRWESLLEDIRSRPAASAVERLVIKTDKRMVLVPVEELDWVEAADNYVVLHVGKENHIQRETLSAMLAKLPEASFVRISRSTIVNINRIKELQPLFHGEYTVILKNGTRLTLTRSYRESLARLGLS
jgi:two-component system LytT family response regulator